MEDLTEPEYVKKVFENEDYYTKKEKICKEEDVEMCLVDYMHDKVD